MTNPSDELRAAAETLRKLAAEATSAPWTWKRWHSDTCSADCDDPTCFLLIVGSPYGPVGDADVDRDVFAVERSVQERGESDAAYIAAMGPNVGALLADVFTAWARIGELDPDLLNRVGGPETLAVARAINTGGRP